MKKHSVFLAIGILAAANGSLAAPGDLDSTFGDGGKVTTDLRFIDLARDVAVQQDGKIVVVGGTSDNNDFALARYNRDGSLDPSFGEGGKVITDFFGEFEDGQGVAIQPDGKIIVVGEVFEDSGSDFGLARYNSNGTLDQHFGIGGKVTTDFGGFDLAAAVVLQRDGKIVVAGGANNNFGLARYNRDGSLDPSFGEGGKVETDFGGTNETAPGIALQRDGKIVVVGFTDQGHSDLNMALVRYNTDGSMDMSFGDGGKVITDFFGDLDTATGIVVQRNGKIVVAGNAFNPDNGTDDFALARYNRDGSLDARFGRDGKVTTDFGEVDIARAISLDQKNRIVVAGFVVNTPSSDDADFALARYHSDGRLDSRFGTGGKVTTDFGDDDAAGGMVIQQDGKIVLAGSSGNGQAGFDFAIARYLAH
jgi:uncharacterized delta-60 repeat protein